MIPGDGIGPELMLHVKSVFRYGVHGGGDLSTLWREGQRASGGRAVGLGLWFWCLRSCQEGPSTGMWHQARQEHRGTGVPPRPLAQSQVREGSSRAASARGGPGGLPGGRPEPAALTQLCPRHACVPVDFEEVHVSSNADEEDIRNAIMAIRRNRVALKGELVAQEGTLCTVPFTSSELTLVPGALCSCNSEGPWPWLCGSLNSGGFVPRGSFPRQLPLLESALTPGSFLETSVPEMQF